MVITQRFLGFEKQLEGEVVEWLPYNKKIKKYIRLATQNKAQIALSQLGADKIDSTAQSSEIASNVVLVDKV